MFRSIFTNSAGILTSRILGFLRDMLQASILGANIYTDIFIVAFKLPNLFRRIFAEGAFTQSFLPAFTHSRHKSLLSASIFLRFFLFLLLMSGCVALFDDFFTRIIASGFSPETIRQAAPLVAINFTYLPLIFVVTFLATLLQYKNHFATTAFATALLNISIITALLLAKALPPDRIIWHMSYAVVIGGILQVAVHLLMAKRYGLLKMLAGGFGYLSRKKEVIAEEKRRFERQFFASVVGSSTAQISAFLDGWLATFLAASSISYLYYANRIFQFPLALFAIATSVAIFPKVSRYLKNDDTKKALSILGRSFWLLLFLLTFATLVGLLFSEEIVWLLYERGAFGAADRTHTALILSMYLLGLLPFGLSKIFSLWLYATHRQKKAAQISGIALGVNILLSLALIVPLKAAGLALASSLSGIVLFVLTIRAFGTKRFLDILWNRKLTGLLLLTILLIPILLTLKDMIRAYL